MIFSTRLYEELEKQRKADKEALRLKVLEKSKLEIKKYFSDKEIKSVYITGSILIPGKFTQRSDIDIAVEGIDADEFFSLYGDLMFALPKPIDLIDIKKDEPFSSMILKEAVLL